MEFRRNLFGWIAVGLAVAVLLVVLVAGCAYKSMVSGYETKTNVVGQVVDASTKAPLTGVIVEILPPNGKTAVKATTDESGYFQIMNMTTGKIGGMASKTETGGLASLTIQHPGYKPFTKKFAIQGTSSMSLISTTDVGTIELVK